MVGRRLMIIESVTHLDTASCCTRLVRRAVVCILMDDLVVAVTPEKDADCDVPNRPVYPFQGPGPGSNLVPFIAWSLQCNAR